MDGSNLKTLNLSVFLHGQNCFQIKKTEVVGVTCSVICCELFCLINAEVKVSSDKVRRIHVDCVQSLSTFGQGKANPTGLCPKFRHLRTKEARIIAVVSEVQASSDKGNQNHRVFVRSLSNFGQG